MSTLTIKVCEECGAQSATADGWLVTENIEIRQAKAGCSGVCRPCGEIEDQPVRMFI